MQEGVLAAFLDAGGDRADQAGGQAPAAVAGVGADGADLGPAGRVEAFAGQGDQASLLADTEVGAQFDGAGQVGK